VEGLIVERRRARILALAASFFRITNGIWAGMYLPLSSVTSY
jgi:hypothetical protein